MVSASGELLTADKQPVCQAANVVVYRAELSEKPDYSGVTIRFAGATLDGVAKKCGRSMTIAITGGAWGIQCAAFSGTTKFTRFLNHRGSQRRSTELHGEDWPGPFLRLPKKRDLREVVD